MDNMTMAEESCSLLSFRIRCPRAKKRALREHREKQLRKLDREQRELRREQRRLGYVDLEQPLMRGWKRTFVLQPDVVGGRHATFYQQVLEKINTVQYHPDRHFLAKKRIMGRKKRVPRKQHLLTFSAAAFSRRQFTVCEQRKFHTIEYWSNRTKRFETAYVFSDQWCFRLQVRPNMITKVRLESTLMEQRLQEIGNYLEGYALYGQLHRLHGRSYRWWRKFRKRDHKRLRRRPVELSGTWEV